MSEKNSFLDDCFQSYKTLDKFKDASKQAIEELEKMNDYQKIVDEDKVYYCSLLTGYNRMFTFKNNLLFTCEYFYEENVNPELEIKKGKNKNYNRKSNYREKFEYVEKMPSYIEYYDNGKIFSYVWYKDGKIFRDKNCPVLPAVIIFKDDGIEEQLHYNKDGKLHNNNNWAKVVFKNGFVVEDLCEYYIDGVKISNSEWNNGEHVSTEKILQKTDAKNLHSCQYCKNSFSTKYRLQDHLKICGAKKLLDENKELKVFLECKKYYKEIFDYIAQKAAMDRDYELLKLMKDNNI